METLVLTIEDIHKIIRSVGLKQIMLDCIAGLKNTYQSYNDATQVMKARDGLDYPKYSKGIFEWMPMQDNLTGHILIKLVSYNPLNPERNGLPTIMSNINIADMSTGDIIAIMEGSLLTAIRTGAASAVASELLAHPDSSTLGLIGCGAQAVTQLHALSLIFNFNKVYVFDTCSSTMASFADRVADFYAGDISLVSLDVLEQKSDIICTATSVDVNKGPVLTAKNVKPYLHINAIGSDLPGKIEVPISHLKKSSVHPDFFSQAIKEGECQQLKSEEVNDNIITLFKSNKKDLQDRYTVYDSTGLPLQDLVIANIFMNYAGQMKIGRFINFSIKAYDPKDPYICSRIVEKECI